MDQPILPWIRAITKYRTIDYLRWIERQPTTALDHHADHLVADTPDLIETIDLKNMVHRLKGKTRQVLESIGLNGKDISSTALALNISENAVRIAFHRGLEKLSQLCRHKKKGHGHD